MRIIFLGTGGGRSNLINQLLWTGGFRIEGSLRVHVDPGPGALVRSLSLGYSVLNLDGLIVSHFHLDHVSDANVLIEGITQMTRKRRGFVIASEKTISEKAISSYHQKLVSFLKIPDGKDIEYKSMKLETIFTRHPGTKGFGFKMYMDGKTIGYTSDTEYFDEMSKFFKNCDVLIANTLKPKRDKWKGHFTIEDAKILFEKTKPKLGIMSHFNIFHHFKNKKPEEYARDLSEELNLNIIAAKDGMKINL